MNIRILVAGVGQMGHTHLRAYQKIENFEVVGIVSRSEDSRKHIHEEHENLIGFNDFHKALAETKPDAVSINTKVDTHHEFAVAALKAGAHVFIEKPLARNIEECEEILTLAREHKRKLVVGYILHHAAEWAEFKRIGQTLGKPLFMRMSLNQRMSGQGWMNTHKVLKEQSPIVDCGVHYVDYMCGITRAKPVSVYAIGARLDDELVEGMYNFGHLTVRFDDGSVGWYEAGWGPMIPEENYFIKDITGPKGCVCIKTRKPDRTNVVGAHALLEGLLVHRSETGADGNFIEEEKLIPMEGEDHDELTFKEQTFFLRTIEEDMDLEQHMVDAVHSLRIVLAADESVRTGEVVHLT